MRRESLPADELMGRRMETGVLAVLAQLGAKRNWHRIMREWVYAEEPATERTPRRRLSARGSSGGYVAPLQRTPSLTLTQPSTGPYIPPPVANPSERINQLNQSFPLNNGLGNNPTDRDAYVRYNLNR